MAIAQATGPCAHGIVDGICWRCTRANIGAAGVAIEWTRLRLWSLRRIRDKWLRKIVGAERFGLILERRLERSARRRG
jgi:hypothetical protein